jgi:cytochrome c2
MFDTMTFTKVLGSFCGALLIFLLGSWAAESLYHTGGKHGEDHAQGYVIDTGEGEGAEEVAEEGPSFAELYAAADVGKGERVYNKCAACHKLEQGANGTGPYLYGVVGRDVAASQGFSYSGNLIAVNDVWTPEELDAFLANPKGYAPGTTMGFAGLPKAEDRANLIAFLDMTDGDMTEVSAAAPAAQEEAAAEPAAEPAATETAQAEAAPAETAQAEAAPAEAVTAEEPATTQAEATPAAEAEAAAATADAGGAESAFAQLVAATDPSEGESLYRRCAACHKLEEGANGVGPYLYGVVGREIGSVEGFRYSNALQDHGGVWTADELNAFLENPKEYAPGNKMSFAGLRKEEDRAAVVSYLQSVAQ